MTAAALALVGRILGATPAPCAVCPVVDGALERIHGEWLHHACAPAHWIGRRPGRSRKWDLGYTRGRRP